MILIFDLDDTLYPEISFVKSGFSEVAKFLNVEFGLNYIDSLDELLEILSSHGRGAVFDIFLRKYNLFSKKLVKRCISKYRLHVPSIQLYTEASEFLETANYKMYLVTDGNKIVQRNKIKALNIRSYFQKILITHEYGIQFSKPSLHCFEIIKRKENCSWTDLIYVADNPTKDFVNLNLVGSTTGRVLSGSYRSLVVPKEFDGKIKVSSLNELNEVLASICT
jgi:putative hydrolase of the HAD superfamily